MTNQQKNFNDNKDTQFGIQRQYLKNLIFKSISLPEAFKQNWEPKYEIKLDIKSEELEKNVFEVILSINLKAKSTKLDVYEIVAEYASIFGIIGLKDEPLNKTLSIFCPNLIFPYLRESIDNVLVKASLPPAMLAPINFELVYEQLDEKAKREAHKFLKDKDKQESGDSQQTETELAKIKAELAKLKAEKEQTDKDKNQLNNQKTTSSEPKTKRRKSTKK